MKRISQNLVSFAVLALLFASCGGASTTTDQTQEIKKEQVEQDVKDIVYPLPTSFEVTNMLNRIGAAYILALSNPTTNADRYFTEKSRALNLGVYSADLSYASTYNQKQETMDFLAASRKLIEGLDITAAVNPNIVAEIEKNQDNKEELVKLISGSFYDTYSYLNKNDKGAVSMYILAGSWVEALYIATHISEETYNNPEMVTIVMNQKENLTKLVELMSVYKNDSGVAETLTDLQKLVDIYNALEPKGISAEQLNAISESVKVIREKFVS